MWQDVRTLKETLDALGPKPATSLVIDSAQQDALF